MSTLELLTTHAMTDEGQASYVIQKHLEYRSYWCTLLIARSSSPPGLVKICPITV